MPAIPNQPYFEDSVSLGSSATTSGEPSYWISLSADRVRDQPSSYRGKQYELDAVQTGEYRVTLDNRDGTYTPGNTASAYSPNVTAFRQYQVRAQYPVCANLLTGDQSTMGEATPLAAGTLASTFGMGSGYDAACAIVASGSAWQGTQVLQASIPNGAAVGHEVFFAWQWAMRPGKPHAFQCRVRVPGGAVSPMLHASLVWVDLTGTPLTEAAGTSTSITAGSASWIQLTATGTPPAGAAGAYARITLDSASGAFVPQTDGWQVEYGSSTTSWVQPAWYPVFQGLVERWPQQYDMGGTYAKAAPIVVDWFAYLSQVRPRPSFISEVLATKPRFFYLLNDPVGSTQVADATGKFPPALIRNTPQGAGSLTLGNSVQATTTPSGLFLGYPGPVAAFNQVDANAGLTHQQAGTYIDLSSAGIVGPDTSSGGFTRMIAFRCTAIPNVTGALCSFALPTFNGGEGHAGLSVTGLDYGVPGSLIITDNALNAFTIVSGTACDGNWHLVFFGIANTGGSWVITYDGPLNPQGAGLTGSTGPFAADTLGLAIMPGGNYSARGSTAQIAAYAEWPGVAGQVGAGLSGTQVNNLNSSWRSAWQGDSSGTRYSRILGYAGFTGMKSLQPGVTGSMGSATDIDGQTDALTLLQNVVTTENGNHYVNAAGAVAFEERDNRYNKQTPVFTFGGNTAGGEIPFEDLAFDYDTTRVVGQAQITQFIGGAVFIANSTSAAAGGFAPTFTRTINVTNPQECVDAANYLASRYSAPKLRVSKIRLHPAGYPASWPSVLALEISMRVRVMQRPIGQPLIQFDGFVEKITWGRDLSTGDATVDLEISPADLSLYWVLSGLHTTVKTTGTAGTNSIVLNALPDSASNPASASLCAGLQLTLDPGTASSETLTVSSFSATSPGYTSFTVTFTANMAFTHNANAVVGEKLAASALAYTTNPAFWDALSILGTSTTLSY